MIFFVVDEFFEKNICEQKYKRDACTSEGLLITNGSVVDKCGLPD